MLALVDTPRDKLRFVEIYNNTKELSFKAAYDILKDFGDAEDCVQNVFFYIASHFNKVKSLPQSEIEGFVVTLSEGLAFEAAQKKQRVFTLNDENTALNTDDENSAGSGYEFEASVSDIRFAVAELNGLDRSVLYLYYVCGYKTKEIAEIFGKNDVWARKRLQLARDELEYRLKRGENE